MEKTIIITTHNMEVANDVCNRIALLSKGRIITIDTPDNLKHSVLANFIYEIETPEVDKLTKRFKDLDFIEKIEHFDKNKIRIYFKYQKNQQIIFEILSNSKINNLKTVIPSLEDAFLKFTFVE